MASQATLTGPTGPAQTVTAQVFTDVLSVNLDCSRSMLFVTTAKRIVELDINATTTITDTVTAGSNHTIVVSQ
jgi:hypothetical protein